MKSLLTAVNMTVITRKLNPSILTDFDEIPPLDTSKLPLAFIKYQNPERVYQSLPDSIKMVVDRMLKIYGDVAQHTLRLDYKVRDLKRGQTGCPLPGWHTDYTENPNLEGPLEEHLIFATEVGTEFITTPMDVFPEDRHYLTVVQRNPNYEFCAVKPNTITKYSRLNLHRGPVMVRDCRRVLVRLSKIPSWQ